MMKTNKRHALAAVMLTMTLCGCALFDKTAEHYGLDISIPSGFEAAEGEASPTYISSGKAGTSTIIILEGNNGEGYTPQEYAEKSAAAFTEISGVTVSDEVTIEKLDDMDTILLTITVERTAPETSAAKETQAQESTDEAKTEADEKDAEAEANAAPASEQWMFFYVLDGGRVVNIRASAPLSEAEKSAKTYKKMFESVRRAEEEETTPDPYETLDTGESLPALEVHLELSDGKLAAVMTDENGSEASRVQIGEISVEQTQTSAAASPDDEIVTLPQ